MLSFSANMPKVIFLPITIGLAHIGRMMVVAQELKKRGADVVFGTGKEGIPLLKKEGLSYSRLPEFDRQTYDEKIKKNNPQVYTWGIINKFVNSELKFYQKEKPDLVVFDTRLTAKISTGIANIPSVSFCNTDETPYYDYSVTEFPSETFFCKFLPHKILNIIHKDYSRKFLSRVGPKLLKAIFLAEMIRLYPAVFKFGYKLSKDPYQLFMGDLTLICDASEFRPVKKLPDNVKTVGPIFWEAAGKLPAWHEEIEKKKNIIYVTASGTGDKDTFNKILSYLAGTSYTVVATTGNTLSEKEVSLKAENIFLDAFVPGNFIMPRARLAIFPGGNSTVYQALSYGVPQITTPFHFDQEDNSNQLERIGTGIMLNPYVDFSREKLLAVIDRVLNDDKFRKNANQFKDKIKKYSGPQTAAEYILRKIEKRD